MRFPIAALFLVATLAIAQTQNATKSSYEKDEPTKPAKQYPPQLVNDLIALREAALEDEYAYRQVAHLTENIGPRDRHRLRLQSTMWLRNCENLDSRFAWKRRGFRTGIAGWKLPNR